MSRQPIRQDLQRHTAFTNSTQSHHGHTHNLHGIPAHTLLVALAQSAQDGTFADTAFHLYSRRLEKRKIGGTRVVYANSIVMKHLCANVSRFFNDEWEKDQNIQCESKDYGYESDSDLDECEVVTLADSDSGEDGAEDSLLGELFLDALDIETHEPEVIPRPEEAEGVRPQCRYHIFLPNIAANTWQALIYFIYTGHIHFAPLKSQGREFRRLEQAKHKEDNPTLPPLCSPKSIYRVADIVGIEELKDLAKKDLMSKVTPDTIAKEVFSRFSSMYTTILYAQLDVLFAGSAMAMAMPDILDIIKRISMIGAPYSDNVLTALMIKLSTLLCAQPSRNSGPMEPSKYSTTFNIAIVTPSDVQASEKGVKAEEGRADVNNVVKIGLAERA